MAHFAFLILFCISALLGIIIQVSEIQALKRANSEEKKFPTYIVSTNWLYSPKRDTKDSFVFRKFVDETVKFRNIIVLSCSKARDKKLSLEIIPPTDLAENLVIKGTDTFQETSVKFVDKAGLIQAPGDYDMIAAFVYPNFSALDSIGKFFDNNEGDIHIVKPDMRIHFIAPGGNVGAFIERGISSSDQIIQMSDIKKKCSE